MPYVTTTAMLAGAQAGGYAVAAFNVENMESMQAAVRAAEELNAPVILQTTPSMVNYAGLALYYGMAFALAGASPVPVALHLDHGNSYDLAAAAVSASYSSVMIDGSALPFDENAALAKRVVGYCAPLSIPVEAELGTVGGKEDDLVASGSGYTDPAQACRFVQMTGVNSLAVAIGTAHGFYSGAPKLDKPLLAEIRGRVDVPLVLHGASGVSNEDVRDCIGLGICKVNFATELRAAYTAGVKRALENDPALYDPKDLGKAARASVMEIVKERIRVCGCVGKA